ncbi:MAG: MarR family transcriptional regulator [Thermoleophilaceae bacterium]|nr:MarR family transcriptional regulator [Thermoleophilaceae bacterium]
MHATTALTQASVDEIALPLAALMRHLVTRTSPDFFKEVERLELSFSQVKALNLLTDHDPLSVKGLSDALGLSVAGMSRALDGLVARGMVKRTEDPGDRRARCLALTAKGAKTMEGLVAIRLAGIRAFAADLAPAEREALLPGLTLLAARPEISPLTPPEAPR